MSHADAKGTEQARMERRKKTIPVTLERRKVNASETRRDSKRRPLIDPTTCERDYTDQEVEFMNALDDYKRKSGRMFPTCSEVLEVINSLGYVKLTASQMIASQADNPCAASAKPMPQDLQMSLGDAPLLVAEEQLV